MSVKNHEYEWIDYYNRFPYFSSETIRDNCYPRIMEHEGKVDKAIVLLHGLSDSPYFMEAIGSYFFNELKFNVYIPLLHCHGLKNPEGMESVSLIEWKENVKFSIEMANTKASETAIGGLSTGGTLSLYFSLTHKDINGPLFLFSAALDLGNGVAGEIFERLLRINWVVEIIDHLESYKDLIGTNPYRYAFIDKDGARELALLIKETDDLVSGYSKHKPLFKKIFAAHSESDSAASITGIVDLQKISDPSNFTFYVIPKSLGVRHASLVLENPIHANRDSHDSQLLEAANPKFLEMMAAIKIFLK